MNHAANACTTHNATGSLTNYMTNTTLADAKELGRKAFSDGGCLWQNPYMPDGDESMAWIGGYLDAQMERKRAAKVAKDKRGKK